MKASVEQYVSNYCVPKTNALCVFEEKLGTLNPSILDMTWRQKSAVVTDGALQSGQPGF